MRHMRRICAALLLMLLLPTAVLAHSGKTDSSGGHKDNKNKSGLGSYHYHCGGHPAHLHDGESCPYTKTSSKKETTPKPTKTPSSTPRPTIDVNRSIDQDGDFIADVPFPIQNGDKSIWVELIQNELIELGYLNGVPDGEFGPKTKAAVEAFQSDYGFEADGIVTEEVYATLIDWGQAY